MSLNPNTINQWNINCRVHRFSQIWIPEGLIEIWMCKKKYLYLKKVVMWAVPSENLFGHKWTAKAKISLCIHAVWSGPSLSTNRITGHYRMYQWRANAWMRFYSCIGWMQGQGYKTFFMLNSADIFKFISRELFMLSWVEHENNFITFGPELVHFEHVQSHLFACCGPWDSISLQIDITEPDTEHSTEQSGSEKMEEPPLYVDELSFKRYLRPIPCHEGNFKPVTHHLHHHHLHHHHHFWLTSRYRHNIHICGPPSR